MTDEEHEWEDFDVRTKIVFEAASEISNMMNDKTSEIGSLLGSVFECLQNNDPRAQIALGMSIQLLLNVTRIITNGADAKMTQEELIAASCIVLTDSASTNNVLFTVGRKQ